MPEIKYVILTYVANTVKPGYYFKKNAISKTNVYNKINISFI